jgi:S1-C subfamily serine protease
MAESVVFLKIAFAKKNGFRPWETGYQGMARCSGYCVEHKGKKYIVSNFHCTEYATYIQVRDSKHREFFKAKIVLAVPEFDMTILYCPQMQDIPALECEYMLPEKLEKIYVLGFSFGIDNVSMTKGVINRLITTSFQQGSSNIAIQIDAAIAPGNSGGPVLNGDNKLIGTAFAGYGGYSINLVIPLYYLKYMFDLLDAGVKDHVFPKLSIKYQDMNNVIREYYGVNSKTARHGGVIVTLGHGDIKENDILLEIDGHHIDESGSILAGNIFPVPTSLNEPIKFSYYVGFQLPNYVITFKVWRDGKEQEVKTKLAPFKQRIPYQDERYAMLDKLTFLPLSLRAYFALEHEFGVDFINLNKLMNAEKEAVILAEFSESENVSYVTNSPLVIKRVNGKKIDTFAEFVELVKKNLPKNLCIEFVDYYEKLYVKKSAKFRSMTSL